MVREEECIMPKKKVNKAAAKRFKKTASGKIKYSKAGAGHLLSSKNSKRKRNLRTKGVLSKVERKRVAQLLP
jgi:large subunit ribosomal protein L35